MDTDKPKVFFARLSLPKSALAFRAKATLLVLNLYPTVFIGDLQSE